jgi:membrane-bound serine protease (ClpP class)
LKTASRIGLCFLLAAFAVSVMPAALHAQTSSGNSAYFVASLDSSVDPGAQDFVTSAISTAQSDGITHFVLVLNTFGGEGSSLDSIVQAISGYEASGGTFITLVGPYGATAFSAGAYLAEASTRVYMMNGTAIGSAAPVLSTISTGSSNTTEAFAAYMDALTTQFGRNGTAAEAMVTPGTSYVDGQALQLHVIDGVINASSVSDALLQIGAPADTTIQTEGIRSQIISVLSDPDLATVLFFAGVLAIMIDLFHPTFILSGAGAAAIVLALIGLGFFGASLTALLLMFIGAAFIFLEVKTHHGVSAIGGVVIFIIGVLLIYQQPFSVTSSGAPIANFTGPTPLTYALIGALAILVVVGSIYLYRLRKDLYHRSKGRFDLKNMIGKQGVLTSDVTAGKVGSANIDSEDWSVTSSVDLPKGARVKVKEVHGFTLTVEAITS